MKLRSDMVALTEMNRMDVQYLYQKNFTTSRTRKKQLWQVFSQKAATNIKNGQHKAVPPSSGDHVFSEIHCIAHEGAVESESPQLCFFTTY